MEQTAWDAVNKLYGEEDNINETQFNKEFGKYFDPYDPTREKYSKQEYGQQVGSLLSGYGQALDQIGNKQTFAGGGGAEKMQRQLYEDVLGKLGSARSSYNQAVYGYKDDYQQGLIDTASSLADSITGFKWTDDPTRGDQYGGPNDGSQEDENNRRTRIKRV